MKRGIKIPSKEDFCHKELRKCFSRSLLAKIQQLDNMHWLFECYLEDLENVLRGINIPLCDIKTIKNKIYSRVNTFETLLYLDARKEEDRKKFFKKFKQKDKCFLCSHKICKRCHILRRSYFKNRKKIRKKLKNYEYNVLNIMFLCPNHHDLLDTHKLKKNEIKKIVSYRNKLNDDMMKKMNKEIEILSRNNKLIKNYLTKLKTNSEKQLNKTILKFKKI